MPAIKLIIGLQNPGSAYEHTRHNAGGWFVAALAQHNGLQFKAEKKFHCKLTELNLNHTSCKLVIPLGFMNHSGQPVQALSHFYQIKDHEILVAHDELDLPAGRIKLKTGGGHGGHNGLRDIINKLGSNDFHRLRIGIGHPGHKDLVHSYVLSKPSVHDRQLIVDAIDRGLAVMPTAIGGDMAEAMNQLNS
ncbi:aminoacyl-tRNA hydrolase [Legionella israelensis]|uniref:aminoacyl-tRNA hydrolase n=1 Tax=Legionella israelensis TaxID=454 RepID=UPI00117C7E8E|nr:aminoacyl-tRNA hydrolase [Legionella israelensis]QDP71857.1 aminoacyl-tRNA hydrolase [Legionella israelensis]